VNILKLFASLLVGGLIGALLVPLVFFISANPPLSTILNVPNIRGLGELVPFFLVGAVFAVPLAVVTGLPAYFLLRRYQLLSKTSFFIAGALAGCIPSIVFDVGIGVPWMVDLVAGSVIGGISSLSAYLLIRLLRVTTVAAKEAVISAREERLAGWLKALTIVALCLSYLSLLYLSMSAFFNEATFITFIAVCACMFISLPYFLGIYLYFRRHQGLKVRHVVLYRLSMAFPLLFLSLMLATIVYTTLIYKEPNSEAANASYGQGAR
jgi:hypothetical protein